MTITASYNMGLNASQAEVGNSTFMLSIGFRNKVSIVLSNTALRQAQSRQVVKKPTPHQKPPIFCR